MSTTSVAFAGCARRPSTSTSVRFEPMPRRFTLAMPGVERAEPPAAVIELRASRARTAACRFSTLSMLIVLEFSSLCASTVTIGLGRRVACVRCATCDEDLLGGSCRLRLHRLRGHERRNRRRKHGELLSVRRPQLGGPAWFSPGKFSLAKIAFSTASATKQACCRKDFRCTPVTRPLSFRERVDNRDSA